MNVNGFSSSVSPSQSSNNALGFVIDFSALGNFVNIATRAIDRPYLRAIAGAGLIGAYSLNTLQLTSSQVSNIFKCSRTMSFNFRPYFNAGYGDYQINVDKTRFLYIPSVIVYNQRTGQTVHIRADKLPIQSATVGGVTTSYIPTAIDVQGSIPFYFELDDIVEVVCINPNSSNFGKIALSFFNFDSAAWMQTGIDAYVVAT